MAVQYMSWLVGLQSSGKVEMAAAFLTSYFSTKEIKSRTHLFFQGICTLVQLVPSELKKGKCHQNSDQKSVFHYSDTVWAMVSTI